MITMTKITIDKSFAAQMLYRAAFENSIARVKTNEKHAREAAKRIADLYEYAAETEDEKAFWRGVRIHIATVQA